MGLHGCDNINTGLIRKAILGQDARTATAQGAEAGLTPIVGECYARPLADGIDTGISLVGPLAAGATKASELLAARLAAERAALAAEEAAVNARLEGLLKTPGGTAPHKNSLEYVGECHVYRIKGPDGTYKIGESARGVRGRDGASIRGEEQARRLTRETGDVYQSDIRKLFPDKRSARDYETNLIERYRRRFGDDTLTGNKNNR